MLYLDSDSKLIYSDYFVMLVFLLLIFIALRVALFHARLSQIDDSHNTVSNARRVNLLSPDSVSWLDVCGCVPCLQFISGFQIDMEMVHTAMRPLLLLLGDYRSLSLNVIQVLSSLTQLFPNTFNEKLCEQLLVGDSAPCYPHAPYPPGVTPVVAPRPRRPRPRWPRHQRSRFPLRFAPTTPLRRWPARIRWRRTPTLTPSPTPPPHYHTHHPSSPAPPPPLPDTPTTSAHTTHPLPHHHPFPAPLRPRPDAPHRSSLTRATPLPIPRNPSIVFTVSLPCTFPLRSILSQFLYSGDLFLAISARHAARKKFGFSATRFSRRSGGVVVDGGDSVSDRQGALLLQAHLRNWMDEAIKIQKSGQVTITGQVISSVSGRDMIMYNMIIECTLVGFEPSGKKTTKAGPEPKRVE